MKPRLSFLNPRTISGLLSCGLAIATVTVTMSAHADSAPKPPRSVSRTSGNGIDTPAGSVGVEIRGNIAFTDTEDDVKSLDGHAMIWGKQNGHSLRAIFEAGPGGSVKRTFKVDGKEQAVDAAGKQWLATVIPAILRETTINLESRSKRLYAKGGADAMLDEIERINSNFARRTYIVQLSKMGKLEDKKMQRLLNSITALASDFERRCAYVAVIDSQSLNSTSQAELLRGVAGMHSDFEERTVLTALVPQLNADELVSQTWLGAIKQNDSAFETRIIVAAMSDNSNKSAVQVDLALQSCLHIQSAFELRTALLSIVTHMSNPTSAQVAAYTKAARNIDSDFERRIALVGLFEHAKLDKESYLAALDAISGMSSDFEIRIALVAAARNMPADSVLIERYRKLASGLSDFERDQAEKALRRS